MHSRNLKIRLFRDPELNECSPAARWLFAGLSCLADRDGHLENKPKQIRMEIMPDESNADIPPLLQELADHGLIRYYGGPPDGDQPYIWIPTFKEDQKPHHTEKGSTLPPHPDEIQGIEAAPELETQRAALESPLPNGELPLPNGEATEVHARNRADSRFPIPDSGLKIADPRSPIPEGVAEPSRVGRIGSANVDSAGSGSAEGTAYRKALWTRCKAVVMFRPGEPLDGRDPPHFRDWWQAAARRAADAGLLMVLDEAVTYAEDCRDPVKRRAKDLGLLLRPGAYVASKLRDAGLKLPPPPVDTRPVARASPSMGHGI